MRLRKKKETKMIKIKERKKGKKKKIKKMRVPIMRKKRKMNLKLALIIRKLVKMIITGKKVVKITMILVGSQKI